MPKIGLFVSLFVPLAALNVGMFMWLCADIAEVRTAQSEHGERLARIEAVLEAVQAMLSEHGVRLTRLEDGQGVLRGDLATTNERVARIEGAVAGALGRPFPERLAQAPAAEDSADG